MRRRQRRMRSWWGHEQVSIAAAVATALHQSAEPQLLDAVLAYRVAAVPLLSAPMLADTAAEAVDARTVKFLLQAARKKKEEEVKERLEAWQLAEALEKRAKSMLEQMDKVGRKRKKKKLLRGSSCGRARRYRQWHVRALRAVFLFFAGRLKMPGFSVVWTRRTVMLWLPSLTPAAAWAGLVLLGFSRAVFLCVVVRPKMLRIMASVHQKDIYAVGWFCLSRCTSRCILMLVITGVDQKDSVARAENCGHSAVAVHLRGHQYPCRGAKAFSHGSGVPSRFPSCSYTTWSKSLLFGRAKFLVQVWRRQSCSHSCSFLTISLRCLSRCSHACCVQRQMPCGLVRRKLRIFPQLRLFNKFVHFLVVAQSLIPMAFDSADHRDSPVAVHKVVEVPIALVVRVPQLPFARRQSCSHSSWRKSSRLDVVVFPVVTQRPTPMIRLFSKSWRFRSRSSTRLMTSQVCRSCWIPGAVVKETVESHSCRC